MCDYSLQHVASRPARIGETLVTRHFGTGTRGFCAPADPSCAVCVLPGTELGFCKDIECWRDGAMARASHRTAIFRQLNKDVPHVHHDALELPDGQVIMLQGLVEGQEASVLQLPARPTTAAEVEAQRRAQFAG